MMRHSSQLPQISNIFHVSCLPESYHTLYIRPKFIDYHPFILQAVTETTYVRTVMYAERTNSEPREVRRGRAREQQPLAPGVSSGSDSTKLHSAFPPFSLAECRQHYGTRHPSIYYRAVVDYSTRPRSHYHKPRVSLSSI